MQPSSHRLFLRFSKLFTLRTTIVFWLPILALAVSLSGWQVIPAHAEGSADLYPVGATGFRGNLEWRNGFYGGLIVRRTLLQVFAKTGEVILMGSSAMGNGAADILIYPPGQVTGPAGSETLGASTFGCQAQAGGSPTQGRILSRTEELAGPNSVTGNANPAGYDPCFFNVPADGIYSIVMYGPTGDGSNIDAAPTGQIALTSGNNFDATQATSVAAWDVTVRASTTTATNITGRLFTRAIALFTSGNGNPMNSTMYAVTDDGYRHKIDLNGVDGLGFMLYANKIGFFDSDGATLLYRDVLGDGGALNALDGGVSLARPEYPMFFNTPAPETLTALGIPLIPKKPSVTGFTFTGSLGGNKTAPGAGGTFNFDVVSGVVTQIVISGDPLSASPSFDPTLPTNRVLRVATAPGPHAIIWDGRDNAGNPFPVSPSLAQPYKVQAVIHAGESHFPLLDVENSMNGGGPAMTLINPPGGTCPPFTGGCSGAFYDDRGYRTLNGSTVWTVNAELCGNGPPAAAFDHSNPFTGFNSTGTNRTYGVTVNPNQNIDCSMFPPANWGGFGDAKGLNLWTYYPSAPAPSNLLIVGPLADLGISKTDNTATYKPGGTTTYTIKVTNAGPSNATGATVADTFPPEITGATWTCAATAPPLSPTSCGAAAGAGNINETVNIAAGAGNFLTYTVTATISAGATGHLVNTATVTAPPGITDPNPSNNLSTDDDAPPGGPVGPGGGAAGTLTFTKVADRQVAKPGDPVTFTLTAHNGGSTPVTKAVVSDPVPSMFIVKSASSSQGTNTISGNTVTFTIGTINAGGTVTMKVHTIIDPGLTPPASATNVAVLDTNEYPPLSASVSFDYSASDPGVVREVAGFLPQTGEHPIDPIETPWVFVMTVGFAAIALTLNRRQQID